MAIMHLLTQNFTLYKNRLFIRIKYVDFILWNHEKFSAQSRNKFSLPQMYVKSLFSAHFKLISLLVIMYYFKTRFPHKIMWKKLWSFLVFLNVFNACALHFENKSRTFSYVSIFTVGQKEESAQNLGIPPYNRYAESPSAIYSLDNSIL